MLLAEPRKRVLPLMPAGRVPAPVIGLTGDAAKAALDAKPGAAVKFGRVSLERARGRARRDRVRGAVAAAARRPARALLLPRPGASAAPPSQT